VLLRAAEVLEGKQVGVEGLATIRAERAVGEKLVMWKLGMGLVRSLKSSVVGTLRARIAPGFGMVYTKFCAGVCTEEGKGIQAP
jgi:hypothetical protein